MPNKPSPQQPAAANQDLRDRLEKAEETLHEILSGEADALFVTGVAGAQLFTLKGADQSYRTLIENMSEGALTLSVEGVILYVNRRFAEMLGTPLEKVIGSEIHNWLAPESRQVLQTLLRKDAVDNQREELALTAADGTQVPVYLSVNRLLLDGMPDYFCMVATDLTAQKRNEAILADEKLAGAILEQAADAIVICDENGRIIRASKQAQAFYGENLLGQRFEQAFPLRQRDGTVFYPVGAIDTNHRQSVEARLEYNGQWLDLLVSVGYLKDARNELLSSVVTLIDITEQKQAAEALRSSMEEFRTLAESMPQIVWITRPDGWNIYSNQRWMDYTGLSFEETLEHGWNKPFHPDDRQQAWDAWQHAMATIDTYSIESRLRRADGVYRWWLVRAVPQKDDDGNIIKWFCTCTDIHDLKMAELEISRANGELRESERRFSELLQNVRLISVMLDCEARITYCNEYLLHLTGWRREEVIGRNWFELFVPPESHDPQDIFAALLANLPKAWHHENEILTRSGERRLIRWNNSVLRSGADDVIGTASIGEDITKRKAAESRVVYLNRVYAMLSNINALIVRVHDRDELYREACRVAVETGGFRMAMIGIVDRNTQKIVPVASVGKDEALVSAINRILSSGELASNTMVARAIREKKFIVANDSQSDPQVVFGKEYAEAGVCSMIILPLIVSGEAIGALALYASERNFFHDEELKLLTELAGDIAFAIDHLDKQARLDYLAYYDSLTGLANRTLFHERLELSVATANEHGHKLALVLLDIERFKAINDTLGRAAGDDLLKELAARLSKYAVDAGRLGRIDADHFAIMVTELQTEVELARLIEQRAGEIFGSPFRIGDSELRISARFGIAIFPADGVNADTLFRNAEVALKKAKAGGEHYLFYTQGMNARVAENLTLENQLRQALERGEFVLHYQPKVNLASGRVTSAEALIRWNDPRTGLVPPGHFIPILEETGLIYEVGRWALRQAIADYLRWRNAGLAAVRIAVNVSALQLRHHGFIDEVCQAIAIDPQAAAGLELEITESLIMENTQLSIASLQTIRALGVSIAIDDFGTGFSSLSYLAKLPVDTLKIDRSFVIDMTTGPQGLALVSTIINLAHALNLKVVAEGVETEEQSRLLRVLGCDEIQGFLFSQAVPGEIFETSFLGPASPQ